MNPSHVVNKTGHVADIRIRTIGEETLSFPFFRHLQIGDIFSEEQLKNMRQTGEIKPIWSKKSENI